MAHTRFLTVTRYLFSALVLVNVLLLTSCDLFFDPPPKLVIFNESSGPISEVRIWKTTAEYDSASAAYGAAVIDSLLHPSPETLVALAKALVREGEAAQKLMMTTPYLSDTKAIEPGASRSLELLCNTAFLIRLNDGGGESLARSYTGRLSDGEEKVLIYTDLGWKKKM